MIDGTTYPETRYQLRGLPVPTTTNRQACSTSLEHGLATTTYDDAENKRTAMRAATRRILAVAPRKLNHVSTFRFGDIEDLHQLVTTTDAPAELLAQIRDLGAQVITAPAGK